MLTVKDVSKLTGVSIRTLQYYDNIGLLNPAQHTEAGYRLYDHMSLERLQQIMLFRELKFSLKEIQAILDNPNFDKDLALEQQITMLTLKRDHLNDLITFAQELKELGVNYMSFNVFDTKKIDEYAQEAKEKWSGTKAYSEFEEKSKSRTKEMEDAIGQGLMQVFAQMGQVKHLSPESDEVQTLVKKLQDYITDHYYQCTKEILSSLGQMYCGSPDFAANIDAAGGDGTAQLASDAIAIYCK